MSDLDTQSAFAAPTRRNDVATLPSAFTSGTLIATPLGEVAVEALEIGDRVLTRDNGLQVIQGITRCDVSLAEMTNQPHLGSVRICRGALGHGLPERDMLVSASKRLLILNEDAFAYFEEREVLIAARDLVGRPGIAWAAPQATQYHLIQFEAHEVILSDGAWSESLDPAEAQEDMAAPVQGPARRKLASSEVSLLAA